MNREISQRELLLAPLRCRAATPDDVFGANGRARALYARAGFDEEIVRCFEPLAAETPASESGDV